MTGADLIARARSALDTPTVYYAGHGGQYADLPHPGAEAIVSLKNLKDENIRLIRERLQKDLGIDPDTLPPMPSCDCSGYAWWILNEARADRNTDWIHRDARIRQTRFKVIDLQTPFACQPGDFLVYAQPQDWAPPGKDPEKFGHIGLVTEIDAQGYAARVIHCGADNHLVRPTEGRLPSSIAETGIEDFLVHALYPAHSHWATLACRYIGP